MTEAAEAGTAPYAARNKELCPFNALANHLQVQKGIAASFGNSLWERALGIAR